MDLSTSVIGHAIYTLDGKGIDIVSRSVGLFPRSFQLQIQYISCNTRKEGCYKCLGVFVCDLVAK